MIFDVQAWTDVDHQLLKAYIYRAAAQYGEEAQALKAAKTKAHNDLREYKSISEAKIATVEKAHDELKGKYLELETRHTSGQDVNTAKDQQEELAALTVSFIMTD
jgi:hypothetical protein